MRWVLGASTDIVINYDQLQARKAYIQRVTAATEVSDWSYILINGQICKDYLCCSSDDCINGTFITAHIGGVLKLCSLKEVCMSDFVVANTCIWQRLSNKELLWSMKHTNQNVELWFAQQELSIDGNRNFRQSSTLNNVGQFGFQSSLSERKLFLNRSLGFMEAIQKSFERVSPLILPKD